VRESKNIDYWSKLLIDLRIARNWTQDELAKELNVKRETVARWETEAKYPSIDNQHKIGVLAAEAKLASVYGITKVVNISPFPMILTDHNDFVLAASKSSGFEVGKTVAEQTPEAERDNYYAFSKMVSDTGFWSKSDNTFEYEFEIDGHKRKAVIQSVGSRGHIFALVQKL
jgi:DNA-binding XRE family transcriptional regulator